MPTGSTSPRREERRAAVEQAARITFCRVSSAHRTHQAALSFEVQSTSTVRHRSGSGMQAVATQTTIGQPGYGWRYFVDARQARAVVISPEGNYFYSHGKGLSRGNQP